MSERDNKRFYWLKLQKDFFKRHDIRIVENMPNGKDYILFYLKLLCESTSHNGELRFSETIPYNEDMLSTITSTNVDIVRQAIKVFKELHMLEIFDDGTLYMTEIDKMLGSESGWAIRKREQRRNKKIENWTMSNDCPPEIDIEIDIDKDIYINNTARFAKPTLEDVTAYCKERNNSVNPQSFIDFYESKGWYVGKNKMKDWKACVRTWERNSSNNKKDNKLSPKYKDMDYSNIKLED